MADFFRGLRGGFETGLEFGKQLRKRRMEDEIARLGPESEVVEGTQFTVTDPEGKTSTGLIGNNATADVEGIRKSYESAGYKFDIGDKKGYAARAGSYDVGVFDDKGSAKGASDRYGYGLLRRQADVYSKYGMPDEARALRRDATAMENEAERMAMARETHKTNQEIAGYQTRGLQRAEAAAIKEEENKALWDAALQAIYRHYANDDKARVEATKLAYENIFGPEKAMEFFKKYDDATISALTRRATEISSGFSEALRTGGLPGVIEWYSSVNNGRDAKLVTSNGKLTVVEFDPKNPKDARVVASGKSEHEVLMQLEALMTPGGALKLAEFELNRVLADAAKIKADAAMAAARRSSSGAGEKLSALNGYLTTLVGEIANIDRALANNPNNKALILQRDEAYRRLRVVRNLIEQTKLGLTEGLQSSPADAYAPGTVIDVKGKKYIYNGGDPTKEENYTPVSTDDKKDETSKKGLIGGKNKIPFLTIGGKTLSEIKAEQSIKQEINNIRWKLDTPGVITNPETRAALERRLRELQTAK